MSFEILRQTDIECRAASGQVVARLRLWLDGDTPQTDARADLIRVSDEDARAYDEAPIQLRERARYLYELTDASQAVELEQGRGIRPHPERPHQGILEPRDNVGRWRLVVVRQNDPQKIPLGIAEIEVRSVKLDYREHYRGMLTYIAERAAGLLLDSRAPTQLRLDTLWQTHPQILEQQIEFLRHTLESSAFRGAVNEVLRNPHRRLEDESRVQSIARPFKPNHDLARQLQSGGRRVSVPVDHPLRAIVPSVPAEITTRRHADFYDTAENRFIKMTLVSYRDFLVQVLTWIASSPNPASPENAALTRQASRLRGMLETLLNRGFLPDVSRPSILPLGSPVLQNRSGYRELYRYWLQFHASAQLAWDGGEDIYSAGSRDVASLYEYWLFFQLESLFRKKFSVTQPLHEWLIENKQGLPHLNLNHGIELKTPLGGAWSATTGRRLAAEFHFNHRFEVNKDHTQSSSWTRRVRPDYTFSIWPDPYTRQEAEANELMAHVHFDAKYRVERVTELFGEEGAELAEVTRDSATYDDLLKMHAYRDAIRRTAGAYVLYPGNPADAREPFQGYHEILPGLGAFALRPRADGTAEGLGALEAFIDRVIEHLANRTTARERVSYHTQAAYQVKETQVEYNALALPEADIYGKDYRVLPPAEHMVLCAWYENDAQLALARQDNGLVFVRLGRRAGALHIHPDLAQTRHILLRTYKEQVANGLLILREPGFRVYTRAQLRAELQAKAKQPGVAVWDSTVANTDDEYIYALFQTKPDPAWDGIEWDGQKMIDLIEAFESDIRHKPIENVGRTSPYPRLLPLRDLLSASVK